MKTNMKELNLNDMNQVNGGAVATGTAIAAAIVGIAALAVKITKTVYECVTED